jgi:hypothetical protein
MIQNAVFENRKSEIANFRSQIDNRQSADDPILRRGFSEIE